MSQPLADGAHDFDFLHGTWRIHNRKLRNPLSNMTEWYEFEGRAVERPFWDGQGNLEEYDATLPDGTAIGGWHSGCTTRWRAGRPSTGPAAPPGHTIPR